ncbi:methyltransferase domain-containing protein [Halorubrum sp. JWXQ-INN 858]|uniref:class I SAM-dependent methyltransferase n=1 Tax=Halorubrum sp. JWXQ-INN 858 TaxID=2690782 RepID=UPI001356A7F1|nr:class I SAM-dependent methyltransferase [Halorubrum sp. JWXQ-INN 858]MWV65281.1 methyltransferase domain-containing protein [Halorubrum sp. JWXQ-INN 858]
MKRSVEEMAARFTEQAADYDEEKGAEYRACAALVIEYADPDRDDVVLDLGTGTGAIALALAPDAERVIGRDISEGMLDRARRKAADAGIENVEFGYGEFRDPDVPTGRAVDVVTSNFALHHLDDDEKRAAIRVMAGTGARRIVLGDVMFFEGPDPDEPFYNPDVDDPSTVGTLVEAFTDVGFAVVVAERVHDQVGVLVAERIGSGDEVPGAE